jgi:hypothetical protein
LFESGRIVLPVQVTIVGQRGRPTQRFARSLRSGIDGVDDAPDDLADRWFAVRENPLSPRSLRLPMTSPR